MSEGLLSPARLEQQRQARKNAKAAVVEEKEDGSQHVEATIQSSTPRHLMKLMGDINGAHWTCQKRHLDNFEILCRDDRTFQIVRRVALDVINEEMALIRSVVYENLAGVVFPSEPKENGNG